MAKKKDALEEFNHIAIKRGMTYAQAQTEESCQMMFFGPIPEGYHRAGQRKDKEHETR